MSNLPAVQAPDPFQEMERLDEQAILDEIKGRAIDALVYEFEQQGSVVRGLSLAGVRETVRSMNANGKARIGVSDREPIVSETDEYFEVRIFAHDTMNGGGYWGIKRQLKVNQTRRGPMVNPFAYEQALAKAQRNAMRGLIPEWFVKEMIDAWRQQGRGKQVNAPARRPGPETVLANKLDAIIEPEMRRLETETIEAFHKPEPKPTPAQKPAPTATPVPNAQKLVVSNTNQLLLVVNAETKGHYKHAKHMWNALEQEGWTMDGWPDQRDLGSWERMRVTLVAHAAKPEAEASA